MMAIIFLSGHDTILLNLVLDASYSSTLKPYVYFNSRPAWYKVKDYELSHYKDELNLALVDVRMPKDAIVCRDLQCIIVVTTREI
jgi:hypothetical protein